MVQEDAHSPMIRMKGRKNFKINSIDARLERFVTPKHLKGQKRTKIAPNFCGGLLSILCLRKVKSIHDPHLFLNQ